MATVDLNEKENFDSQNVVSTHQAHQPHIIENLSYCEIHQKNKPQSNSVTGATCFLMVSGLQMGWGIWNFQIVGLWTLGAFQFALMSWYVFAAVGSLVGAVLVTKMQKKFIYYIGGALLIVSSIMFIALYKEHAAIIVGRCLAGFSHGIIYNATITHATENVVKELRGMLLSSINSIIVFGVFLGTLVRSAKAFDDYHSSINIEQVFGIFGLSLPVLGIVCTTFFTYESVPYLLRRDNEHEAIVNFLKLRNESVMTRKLTNEFDEMRLMVDQDKQENQNILSNGNGVVVGKMIALRVLAVMTNNFLINYLLINMVTHLPVNYDQAPMASSASRLAASFIPIISTYFIRRKIHLTVSSVTSALVILLLGIIFASLNDWSTYSYPILGILSLLFQILVSLGIDPMQHQLLSEAFSTSKKAWSIALVTWAEYALQILFIGIIFISPISYAELYATLFVTAGVMLALALFLQFAIPETHNKSMKETRDLFSLKSIHERHSYHNERDDPLSAHLFAIDGSKWKSLRSKLTPTFTSGKMKFMFRTVLEIGDRLSERLNSLVVSETPNNQCVEVEIKNYWARYTTDVIGSCAFGLECNTLNDKDALFLEMGRQVAEEPRRSLSAQLLLSQVKEYANFLRIKQLTDKPTEFFMGIVKETLAYRQSNKIERKDFMHLLIELKNNPNSELDALTDNEIAAQAFVFFFAGFETSSTLLSFCSYELAKNPEIQEKVRTEVKNVLKRHNGEFSYDAMLEMKYMDQVLKESLRKYPPLTMLTRGAAEDYWIKDLKKPQLIPKGCTVVIPVYAIHNDPDIYPDPNRFDPDRFLPDEENKRHPFAFLPFGEGPRVCIGLRFGMMQARIGLAKTLLNFNLSLGAKTDAIRFVKKQFFISNEGGIWLKLEKIN